MRLEQLCNPLATVLLAVGCSSSSNPTGSSSIGCTGSHEIIQNSTGLCVAKMVTITGPASDAGGTDYSIDVTEVTKGQYDAWLATNPPLPASTDADCGNVTSYAEQTGAGTLYTGTDAAHHPVADVDWCDAYAYCKGVGKRLCGAIGGGANASASYADATLSQWYRACSSGGLDAYPYGNTYSGTTCDGYDYWNDNSSTMQTVAVGSLANCVTSTAGFAGVYDLSGNVWEWEDSCDSTGPSAYCRIRGGSFGFDGSGGLACDYGYRSTRRGAGNDVGFRCCAP
jgi:formylglycine-generating enzyme